MRVILQRHGVWESDAWKTAVNKQKCLKNEYIDLYIYEPSHFAGESTLHKPKHKKNKEKLDLEKFGVR